MLQRNYPNYPPIVYGRKRKLREGVELANEEFFYQDLVLPVEEELIKFIFDARGGKKREAHFDFVWPYPVDPQEFDDIYSSSFEIVLSIYPEEGLSGSINVAGDAGTDESNLPNIIVKIEYTPGVDLDDHYKFIVSQLRHTLAHEIHHLTQDGPLKRPDCPVLPDKDVNSYLDYFTMSCEIPAFMVGFRAESNFTGKPAEELIKKYLEKYQEIGALSASEALEVEQAWTGHSFA
jgi:hypothetical protein|tara:strand:+ start:1112 stop:1813 length:702 start_codon:yes stop_codon:yes gene_type:complete